MNYLLDTCVVSDFLKKDAATIANFQKLSPEQLYVSSITAMEIEYGLALNPDRAAKLRPLWQALVKLICILPFSDHCGEITAKIRADLKKTGQLIGPYDILIAGSAIAHGMTIVTSNMKEFMRIPEAHIENWRSTTSAAN